MRDKKDSVSEGKVPEAGQGASHPPDDVTSLYSWANLHGVKYRDFSASRQQVRAQNRYRLLVEGEPAIADEPQHRAVAIPDPAGRALEQPARLEPPAKLEQSARPGGWQELAEPMPAAVPLETGGVGPAVAALIPVRNAMSQLVPVAPLAPSPRGAQSGSKAGSDVGTPARLDRGIDRGTAHRQLAPEPAGKTPEDGLRQTTEEAASRWFALQGLLAGRSEGAGRFEDEDSALPVPELRAPVVAIFSVAGGVGKTSLTAGVARALSARGEHVLAVETSAFGMLPFYFGARDLRPGAVRTFASNVENMPIHVLSLDTEQQGKDRPAHWLRRELYRASREVSRILIDVSGGFHGAIEEVLRLKPTIVIPVHADGSAVASLEAVDACFRARQQQHHGELVQPYFLLYQFDPTLPLHLDVRQVLAQKFGDRLLPLVVHRSPLVREALAEGLTAIDYAPGAQLTEDLHRLAGWMRGLAPVATSFRGVRWSER